MRTNKHKYGERAFWVKMLEAEMIRHRELTVVIRTDDRSSPIKAPQQWLPLGYPIPIYFIERPGDQTKGVAARFYPDNGTTVMILHREIVRLGDLTDKHLVFAGGTAVPQFLDVVKRYLGEELVPGKDLSSDTILTLYYIEYLPNEVPADN